jgi:hypothetical protein
METIFLHESQKVVSIQMALLVGVHTLESVVDCKSVGSSNSLLG